MSWDKMKQEREKGGGSLYIKLKDGGFVEGLFRGEPHFFYQVFKDKVEYENWAEGRSFKFKINFITKNEEGKLVAKVFQGGSTLRDMLLDAREEYGLDCVFKIKRTGSTKDDTRYSILFKKVLTPEEMEGIKGVKLISLEKKDGDQNFAAEEPPPPETESDLPF